MKKFLKSFWTLAVLAVVMLAAGCGGDDGDVVVTAITLDKSELTLDPGDTQQLTATIVPENATNKRIVWSSEDDAIATVTNDGLVTAVAKGNIKIWVKTPDGTVSASTALTVNEMDFAKKVKVGTYKGAFVMYVNEGDATPKYNFTNMDAVVTYVSLNMVKVKINTLVQMLSSYVVLDCDLTVSPSSETGKYNVTGATSVDFGPYTGRATTITGYFDSAGNVVMDCDIATFTEKIKRYTGVLQQ